MEQCAFCGETYEDLHFCQTNIVMDRRYCEYCGHLLCEDHRCNLTWHGLSSMRVQAFDSEENPNYTAWKEEARFERIAERAEETYLAIIARRKSQFNQPVFSYTVLVKECFQMAKAFEDIKDEFQRELEANLHEPDAE